MPFCVVGLGNELMSDDGVGIHAVRELRADPSFGVLTFEVGTAILDALPVLESTAVVVALDAIQGGRPPGTIYRFDAGELDPAAVSLSLHDLDLPAALHLIPAAVRPRVIVLGIEPAVVAPGMALSDAVGAALPRLLTAVRELLRDLADKPAKPIPLDSQPSEQ